MAVGDHHALRHSQGAIGAAQGHARRALCIPAGTHRRFDADVAAVGLRQLDLSGTALRAKDADMLQFALGADDVQTFLAGKLAGLAQRLLGVSW